MIALSVTVWNCLMLLHWLFHLWAATAALIKFELGVLIYCLNTWMIVDESSPFVSSWTAVLMSLHSFVVYMSIIQLFFLILPLLKSKKRKQNGTIKELLVSVISFYYQWLICFTIDMSQLIDRNCPSWVLPELGGVCSPLLWFSLFIWSDQKFDI